jgi:hypothetical protein
MSTVVVGTIQSNSTSPPTFNNTNGTEIGTLCRAFVNFNGTGTVAIRASFNVSSITDNGAGDYTVNFTTAMPDANYSMSGSCLAVGATNVQNVVDIAGTESAATTYSTTQCRVVVGRASNGNPTDNAIVNVAFFR